MILYILPVNYFMKIGMIPSYSSRFTNEEHRLHLTKSHLTANGADTKLFLSTSGTSTIRFLLCCSFHTACAHPTTSVKIVKLDLMPMTITMSC